MTSPTGETDVTDVLPQGHRAGFFGAITGVYSVAGIVAPYLLGLIVHAGETAVDGYSNGFLVVGLAICVFAIVGGRLLNPGRSREVLPSESANRKTTGVGGSR